MTDGEKSLSEEIAEAEGIAVSIRSHLDKLDPDQCAYCLQYFGPDEAVIEKEVHGRKFKFCDEDCYAEFMKGIDFEDEE